MKHRDAGIYKGVSQAVYPDDLLSDQELQGAPPEARGVWCANILPVMWRDRIHTITAPIDALSRRWGVDIETAERIISLIEMHKIGDVSRECPGVVSITCRRLKRQSEQREIERIRKASLRCPGNVPSKKVLPPSPLSLSSPSSVPVDVDRDKNGEIPPQHREPMHPAENADLRLLARQFANKTGGREETALKDFGDQIRRGLLTAEEISEGIERFGRMGKLWPSSVIEPLLQEKGQRQATKKGDDAIAEKRRRFNALYQAVKSGRVKEVKIGGKAYSVTGCDGDAVVRIRDGDGERSIVVGTVAGVTW